MAPGSMCPCCGHPIRWYDNIPVLSWAVLRARCRDCGCRISLRYPAVEVLSGTLWVAAGVEFGLTPALAPAIAFFYLLMVLAFVDIDTGRLPDPIVAALAVAGAAAVLVSQFFGIDAAPLVGVAHSGLLGEPLASAVLGALAGGGASLGLSLGFERFRGSVGLGGGDVKLLAAMGLYLGPYVLMAMFLGSVLGTLALPFLGSLRGVPLSKAKIRFGPFLSAGGLVTAIAGPALWAWYAGIL